jgi:hypothetical protein
MVEELTNKERAEVPESEQSFLNAPLALEDHNYLIHSGIKICEFPDSCFNF